MPRPERVVDPGGGPVQEFAHELRMLRARVGGPGYRELAERTPFAAATLAEAAGGRRMPTLEVTLAYVEVCGGDVVEWRERWQRTKAALTTLTAARHDELSGSEKDAPYLGLAPFQFTDADRFFGRERLVDDLVLRLAGSRFLAVFGASGSGKSSLLRAGLLPAMASGDSPRRSVVFTPGADPVGQLVDQVPAAESGLVVVVDQFEEIFTLCTREEQRRQFIDGLLALSRDPDTGTRVVIGVRADFYGRCGGYLQLVEAMRDAQVLVGPMSEDELRRAVTRPARLIGFSVERALVTAVVADAVKQPGALPMVSHAMREAWLRRKGNVLTLAGYQAAGGVDGAIAQTAERVYGELTGEQQRVARDVLLRLIALGEGTEDTRRRLPRHEIEGSSDLAVVLDRLAAARLLTLDADTVDVAHEALIRCWPRLRGWLTADREGLRLHRQLTEATQTWRTLGHDPGSLYRGARLTMVGDWLDRAPETRLTAAERSFLDASRAAEERERGLVASRIRVRRLITGALAALLVLAVAGGAVAVAQRRAAVEASQIALSRQKAAETAQALDAGNMATALTTSLDSYRAAPTVEGRSALLSAASGWGYHGQLRGHAGLVHTVAFQPGGHLLASGAQDGEVILWDTRHKQQSGRLQGHQRAVRAVQFSPDGRLLASASVDRTVMIWDVARHRAVRTLRGHTGMVTGLAFSPDGSQLASIGVDRTVRLWQVADGTLLAELPGPGGTRPEVAFSPNGSALATAGDDGTVVVWDLRRRTQLATLAASTLPLFTVAFSPDGRLLAAAGQDRVIRLWDTRTWTLAVQLQGHAGQVRGLAFTPASDYLVSVAFDRTAMLWDIKRKGRVVTLPGHDQSQYDVALSPDGQQIATASVDQTILLWDRDRLPLAGHTQPIRDLVFSPDGRTLASASDDSSVALWDPARRTVTARLSEHDSGILAVAYSPDGRLIASGGQDQTVVLWDAARNTEVATLAPHRDLITSLAFQPGGRLLAVGLGDGTVVIWDVLRHVQVRVLRQHRLATDGVAFSPDGRLLAAAGLDRTVTLWRVETGTLLATLCGNGLDQNTVAFSPDGLLLATGGGDGVVRIWDVAHRSVVATLAGHVGPVEDLAFRPDGRFLASAGQDHTVVIWDVAAHREWATLSGLFDPVTAVAWSPDGQRLASAGLDHMVTLRQTEPGHAVTAVCRRLERDFSQHHPACTEGPTELK